MTGDAPSNEPVLFVVAADEAGTRLDSFLVQKLPRYSRSHLRKIINAAAVRVDDRREKASHHLKPGERVSLVLPELPRPRAEAQAMSLSILYEDECLVALDKPPGMVVHPGKGNWHGTLVSGLEYHFQSLSTVGGAARPGIVHRLDRDTSGVIVVAKTDWAHIRLARQFEQRTTQKEYFAIVAGELDRDRDWIDQPIGMHPRHREKMAIRRDQPNSRSAQSFYEVVERFHGYTSLKILPKTGRTHQIRVHLASIGCPVLCDRQYGGRSQILRSELSSNEPSDEVLLSRQALHARRLAFAHPLTAEWIEFEAPIPEDLQRTLVALRTLRGR